MRDAARGGAKTPSQRYRSGKTDSSRGIAGSAGRSIRSVGDPRKTLGIASRAGGGSGGAAGKANAVSSRQPSRVTDKIRQIEQMVIMSKHSEWPEGGLRWLCLVFQGSKFEVQGSRFGIRHQRPGGPDQGLWLAGRLPRTGLNSRSGTSLEKAHAKQAGKAAAEVDR